MSDGFTITGCDGHCLANGCARQDLRAEIERLRAAIRVIGRRSAASTRTWDGMIADMGWINDEARRALEGK